MVTVAHNYITTASYFGEIQKETKTMSMCINDILRGMGGQKKIVKWWHLFGEVISSSKRINRPRISHTIVSKVVSLEPTKNKIKQPIFLQL